MPALESLSPGRVGIVAARLQANDLAAALRIGERLFEAGESLATFFRRGRPVGNGRRELVSVRPYILRYRMVGGQVEILRVRHAAQLSPGA